MDVIKRNGDKVEFDINKIAIAVQKATKEVRPNDKYASADCKMVVQNVIHRIRKTELEAIDVELIQDIVEEELMKSGMKDVAKAYITYRYLHGLARNKYQELMDAVTEKLSAKNVQNQNANVDEHSFGGRVGEASDMVMKKYALDYIVSSMSRANHENNEIYIHDLNSYAVGSHNCLSIPFDDLLKNGFNTRQTDVRPAQSVNTAFQLVAVIFQLQSLQQFGGVSATHLDWTMVPYVRKSFWKHYQDGIKYCEEYLIRGILPNIETVGIECPVYKDYYPKAYEYAMDMTIKEVYQAVEGMYHNLNTLQSRSGNQLKWWLANK